MRGGILTGFRHLHGHNIFVLAEGACGSGMNQTIFGNDNGTSEEGHMTNYSKRALEVDYGTQKNKRDDGGYGTCWDGTITNPTNPQVCLFGELHRRERFADT